MRPVLKILRRVNLGTRRKVGTDVAKRYGPLDIRGRKTAQKKKKLRR